MTTTIDGVKTLQIRRAKNGDFDLNLADETARNQIEDLTQDVEQNTSNITVLEQATYNAYPTESESGNPIYFDDGADDIPVKELIVNLEPKQSGSGDPSPSNVRPISGYDGVTVKRTGKNLLKVTATSQTINGVTFTVNEDGSVTANGTASGAVAQIAIGEVPITVGSQYTLSHAPSGSSNSTYFFRYAFRDSNGTAIPVDGVVLIDVYSSDKTVTAPSGAVKLFAYLTIANGTIVNNITFYPMIRLASATDSTFEPYTEKEYSITFPSSVSTVYGGSLNVTTGELVVDKGVETFDGSSDEGWSEYTSFNGYYTRMSLMAEGARMDGVSNMLTNSDSSSSSQSNVMWLGVNNRLLYVIGVHDSMGATLSDFLQYLSSNNLQVVYPLATPTTVQLTPTEVTTLLGSNTITSDGSINLTYRADTTKIIEKLTNAIVSLGGNV